jgi:hypothetical protein
MMNRSEDNSPPAETKQIKEEQEICWLAGGESAYTFG